MADADSGYRIDPHQSWVALETRAAQTDNARHKALLTAVRDHMEAEITGQLEPLMATLIDEPVYHFWGNAEPMVLEGQAVVRGFYQDMIGRVGNEFQVVSERIVVDDDFVVTEGHVRQVHSGRSVLEAGVTEVAGQAVDADGLYLGRFHLITVWPAAPDGRLVGEDIFFGESPMARLEPIAREELPAYMTHAQSSG